MAEDRIKKYGYDEKYMGEIEVLLERIVKAVVNWNDQKAEFDTRFLQYQDNCDLVISVDGNTVTVETKFDTEEENK